MTQAFKEQTFIKKETEYQKNINFYNFFYNTNFPIYFRMTFPDKKAKSGFVNDTHKLLNLAKSNAKLHISICNKLVKFDKLKRPINSIANTRSANFIVVDIDAKVPIEVKEANNILLALDIMNLFKKIPYPSAITLSGQGLHFYYKIDEIYLLKTNQFKSDKEYKNWRKSKLAMFKDTATHLRKKISKELNETKEEIKGLSNAELEILNNLSVDNYVQANTQQLIRAVGSYNHKSKSRCKIIELRQNISYTMTELLEECKTRYEKQDKIITFFPKGRYTKKDSIYLNLGRLEDIKTLINIRKAETTLVGSRQSIMYEASWLILNINNNTEKEGDKLNALEELLNIGKLIGSEFQTETFCINQLRYTSRYYEKFQKFTNLKIIEFLQITEEELKHLSRITPNKETLRNSSRKRKEEEAHARKEEIESLLIRGKTVQEIAQEKGIARSTIYRWLRKS